MPYRTDDVRIQSLRPLLPPGILMEEVPETPEATALVALSREAIGRILHGHDDRLLVVVGPCSIHDPGAGLEYAHRLREKALPFGEDLFVVMRVYFEKPRTTVGWKGLINDPRLDGSFAINEGLRLARRFLADVAALGLPAGTEFLDPISPSSSPTSCRGGRSAPGPPRARCTGSWPPASACRWDSRTGRTAGRRGQSRPSPALPTPTTS
jgi:3-deoxy-7-phosphoheptulonate synthase